MKIPPLSFTASTLDAERERNREMVRDVFGLKIQSVPSSTLPPDVVGIVVVHDLTTGEIDFKKCVVIKEGK